MTDTQALARANVEQRAALERALVTHGEDGQTVLAIPPQLREQYNVLAPAAVLAQQDPYFRPSFTIVTLDPRPDGGDFYAMSGANKGKLAMSKDGIIKIANAGGIDFSGDLGGREDGEMIPVYLFGQKVMEVKKYVYVAIGKYRKSDGTLAAMRAEKEWLPQKEALEIETEASGKDWLKTDADRLAYAKKEFLRSLDFRSMMTKAKAQNAVMRTAYGIKQKFLPAEAAKPFFVVSYNFTAGTDPQSLAIVASLVGADVENLYGIEKPSAFDKVHDALPEAEVMDVTDAEVEDAGAAEVVDAEATTEDGGMFEGVISGSEAPLSMEQAASYRFEAGPYKGNTLGQAFYMEGGRQWLAKVMRGFERLSEEGTATEAQRDCLRHIRAYFMHSEGALP